jgi:hypothetical protein
MLHFLLLSTKLLLRWMMFELAGLFFSSDGQPSSVLLLPKLWPFLHHSISSVRRAALQTMSAILNAVRELQPEQQVQLHSVLFTCHELHGCSLYCYTAAIMRCENGDFHTVNILMHM